MFSKKLFWSVYLAVVYASVGDAFAQRSSQGAGYVTRRGLTMDTFFPETKFETFGSGVEQPKSFASLPLSEAAVTFTQSYLGVNASKVAFKSGYTAETATVAYVKQAHDGIPFANAVANVAWKDNKVVAFGSSFVKTDQIAASKPSLSVDAIIPKAEEALDGKYNGHAATLEYYVKPDGSIALTRVVQIQNDAMGTWYEAFMDAHSGELLGVTDFVFHASYKVVPITKQALSDGQESLTNPQDTQASSKGWHDSGLGAATTETAGNNVISSGGTPSRTTRQSGTGLVFDYTYDTTKAPNVGHNIDAARTNAFYLANTFHDFTYRYGFTEEAYNFQLNNFGKKGTGLDPVFITVQASDKTNDASFVTPADGQAGRCTMYLWTHTSVHRDGSLANDVMVHELAHGVTNRMTGGGTARCLQDSESKGLGEGWSDAMAEWTVQKSSDVKDYVFGAYVMNKSGGMRKYPYSTSSTTNPLRYSSAANLKDAHEIGEVWANMLHNVYAALVKQYGFSATAKTNPGGKEGNIVFLHLFLDALALQPCNPTFVTARDALIQADKNRYKGANLSLVESVCKPRSWCQGCQVC